MEWGVAVGVLQGLGNRDKKLYGLSDIIMGKVCVKGVTRDSHVTVACLMLYLEVQISSPVDQTRHHILVSLVGGYVERRAAVPVLRVDVSPTPYQEGGGFRLVAEGGVMKGAVAVVVLYFEISGGLDQFIHHLVVALVGGYLERRLALHTAIHL